MKLLFFSGVDDSVGHALGRCLFAQGCRPGLDLGLVIAHDGTVVKGEPNAERGDRRQSGEHAPILQKDKGARDHGCAADAVAAPATMRSCTAWSSAILSA